MQNEEEVAQESGGISIPDKKNLMVVVLLDMV